MNGKTAARLRDARKELGAKGNASIEFATSMVSVRYGGQERPHRTFKATGIAKPPATIKCRVHKKERAYGTPCMEGAH